MRRAFAALLPGAAAAAPAVAASSRLDPTHSFVHAEVDHFGTSTIRLRIGPIDGDVAFDAAAKRGYVGLRIATARPRESPSGVPALDARLRERDLPASDDCMRLLISVEAIRQQRNETRKVARGFHPVAIRDQPSNSPSTTHLVEGTSS